MTTNEKKPLGLHKIALAALFTVGNTLLRFPWRGGGSETLWLFLLSVLGALIPAVVCYPLLRRLFRAPLADRPAKRVLAAAVALLLGMYAVFTAFDCMRDYLSFSFETILPGGGKPVLLLLFLGCAVWLSSVGDRGTDIFALLAFAAVALCTVGLFPAGAPGYRPENIALKLPDGWQALLRPLLLLWRETLLPLVLLSAYFALVLPRRGERALVAGTAAGCGLLLICVLQTLLTFGSSLAARYPYPYAYAVRMISVGPYFFRLEGFSYLPDYLACLTRSAVCLAVARRLFGRFFPRLARRVPAVLCVTLLIFLLAALFF
mgnify:FL=1